MGTYIDISIPKPDNEEGHRFFACPYYDRCLGYAARLDWEFFTCTSCTNLALEPAYERAKYITPYYNSLSKIYPEFKTRFKGLMDLFHEGC